MSDVATTSTPTSSNFGVLSHLFLFFFTDIRQDARLDEGKQERKLGNDELLKEVSCQVEKCCTLFQDSRRH